MESGAKSDRADVRILPPGVPLIAVLLGVVLNRFWPVIAFDLPAPARYWIGGAILAVSIGVLILWPVALFRASGESEKPWKPTHHIVKDGPYRFTRNPMYLQMVIGCLAFAILLSNLWILLLTPACAYALQKLAIVPEEVYLEEKFGASYRDYKSTVRRWL